MFWLLPAALAAAGGISNVLSGNAQAKQQRENLKKARQELESGLITKEQLDRYLQTNKMAFGRQLTSLMNTTAIKTGGIANSNVVKAAAAAPVAAAEAQGEMTIEQNAANRNAQIHSQIAQLALQNPVNDQIGNFISGAASGASLGMELGKFGAAMNKLGSTGASDAGTAAAPSTAVSDTSGGTGTFGAENLNTGIGSMGHVNNPISPYSDYLGNDQLNMKQGRWAGFNFSIFD